MSSKFSRDEIYTFCLCRELARVRSRLDNFGNRYIDEIAVKFIRFENLKQIEMDKISSLASKAQIFLDKNASARRYENYQQQSL